MLINNALQLDLTDEEHGILFKAILDLSKNNKVDLELLKYIIIV
jgi:hypothetical protein